MKQPYPYKRIYVLGDHYAGKSTLVARLLALVDDGDISVSHFDQMTTVYRVIETSGMRYELIDVKTNALYFAYSCGDIARAADLILMVYDASSPDSMKMCESLVENMADSFNTYMRINFVGNKCDLVPTRSSTGNPVVKQLVSTKHPNYEIMGNMLMSSLDGRNVLTLSKTVKRLLGGKRSDLCFS